MTRYPIFLLIFVTAWTGPATAQEKSIPVFLNCPDAGASRSEFRLFAVNGGAKYIDRMLVRFENFSAVHVIAEYKERGNHAYKKLVEVDLAKETDPDSLDYGRVLARYAEKISREVCRGSPEAKKQYYDELRGTRAKYGLTISELQ